MEGKYDFFLTTKKIIKLEGQKMKKTKKDG